MKKSNALYISILLLLVVLVGFFFSSKLWMGDDRGNKDVNYDSTIILANAWEVKITDGFYDPETGVLEVKYYAKARQGSKAEPPMLRINLEGTKHQMEALITDMDDNEYGKWIQVQNVPKNWYYIRFTLKCKQEAEETAVSTVDQFGHQSSHEAKEEKEDLRWIQLDYRTAIQKTLPKKDAEWIESRKEMVTKKKDLELKILQKESLILQKESEYQTAEESKKETVLSGLEAERKNLTALQESSTRPFLGAKKERIRRNMAFERWFDYKNPWCRRCVEKRLISHSFLKIYYNCITIAP